MSQFKYNRPELIFKDNFQKIAKNDQQPIEGNMSPHSVDYSSPPSDYSTTCIGRQKDLSAVKLSDILNKYISSLHAKQRNDQNLTRGNSLGKRSLKSANLLPKRREDLKRELKQILLIVFTFQYTDGEEGDGNVLGWYEHWLGYHRRHYSLMHASKIMEEIFDEISDEIFDAMAEELRTTKG